MRHQGHPRHSAQKRDPERTNGRSRLRLCGRQLRLNRTLLYLAHGHGAPARSGGGPFAPSILQAVTAPAMRPTRALARARRLQRLCAQRAPRGSALHTTAAPRARLRSAHNRCRCARTRHHFSVANGQRRYITIRLRNRIDSRPRKTHGQMVVACARSRGHNARGPPRNTATPTTTSVIPCCCVPHAILRPFPPARPVQSVARPWPASHG